MNKKYDESLPSKNTFDYLRLLALDMFDPPVESKELTLIGDCRLADFRFSKDGIVTSGRLWRMEQEIKRSTRANSPLKRGPNEIMA